MCFGDRLAEESAESGAVGVECRNVCFNVAFLSANQDIPLMSLIG
jgi:hypothetical protein